MVSSGAAFMEKHPSLLVRVALSLPALTEANGSGSPVLPSTTDDS